jgi:hypothetical protein
MSTQAQVPYIHKNKIRLDWAAQHAAHKAMGRQELAHYALLRASEKLLTAKGIKLLSERKAQHALGVTTSDYAYIADFTRRLIYKHADDLSWVVRTLGQVPLSTLDLTVEFNDQAELSGPLSETDQGDRTVLTWTKYEIELEKYVGRFLVTDAARARGKSNIQAVTTLKSLGEQLYLKKEREAITELFATAGNSAAATAAWEATGADIETDINVAIGTILNAADSLPPKAINVVVLLPAIQWGFLTAQQSVLNLSVLDHFKKTLSGFEIIPTKFWHTSGTDPEHGIQDDALVYVPGGSTALHGFSANVPFPLSERKRIEAVGWEYFFQQWFRTVTTPDSKGTTTSSRIYKITGVE